MECIGLVLVDYIYYNLLLLNAQNIQLRKTCCC